MTFGHRDRGVESSPLMDLSKDVLERRASLLVGRSDVVSELKSLVTGAVVQRGATVILHGEAGVSKSRLVHALLDHGARRDALVRVVLYEEPIDEDPDRPERTVALQRIVACKGRSGFLRHDARWCRPPMVAACESDAWASARVARALKSLGPPCWVRRASASLRRKEVL
ncbi:MAG: hypothetical protein ACRDWS_03695 [Acidimicrobiia bacterium]